MQTKTNQSESVDISALHRSYIIELRGMEILTIAANLHLALKSPESLGPTREVVKTICRRLLRILIDAGMKFPKRTLFAYEEFVGPL